jgi:hypothetical protein
MTTRPPATGTQQAHASENRRPDQRYGAMIILVPSHSATTSLFDTITAVLREVVS